MIEISMTKKMVWNLNDLLEFRTICVEKRKVNDFQSLET